MIKSYLLKIKEIDFNGNSIANIIEPKTSIKNITIPFNKKNYVFKVGDVVSSLIKLKKERIVDIKIINKINNPKSFFVSVEEIKKEFVKLKNIFNDKNNFYIPVNKIDKQKIDIGSIIRVREAYNSKNNLFKICVPEKYYLKFGPENIIPMIAINDLGIQEAFPKNVLNETKDLKINLSDNRKDLTYLPFITIDGKDAKDFDDAVYAEKINEHLWKIIISIADVSHYVKEGSNLDRHANLRGNSIYFPNYVIPMLPEKLSNDICSLKPKRNRLCISVEIFVDSKGKKISHKFFRSVIQSKKRFNYEQVEKLIETNFKINSSLDFETTKNVRNLFNVFKKLKVLSKKRGALNLKINESKIFFDKNNKPVDINQIEQLISHQIIEELMVLANICAAEELSKFDNENPYRIHEKPKYEKVLSLINSIGKPFDKMIKNNPLNGKLFNNIIENSKDGKDFLKINELILRTQSIARYNNINKGHFGLSLKNYVHFTSPIRRYSDLIVHRRLTKIIDKLELKKDNQSNLKEICDHLSDTERNAVLAERITLDRYKTLIYSKKINKNFVGEIITVKEFGLFLRFDNNKSEGFIPKRFLPKDRYVYSEKKEVLIGKSNYFSIGGSILVSIKETDIIKGKILLSYLKSL